MMPFRLFTAFHANLDFSAIPENDRSHVIASCYWPLLTLPEEKGIRLGIEMSGRTLEILEREDPEWVKRFVGLVECGLVEPIASGRAQVVAPLVPAEVNRLNLMLGREIYDRVLGFVPETYLVNEQTWSDGLAMLYHEANAKRVIMEWNNPAARRSELRPLRCRPARLEVASGDGPVLLFNDSIVFQKMQRVAHGEIPIGDLTGYVERLSSRPAAEALCVYGGDVEIFDYRPSRPVPPGGADGGGEMQRLLATFETLASDSRYEFVLPREIARSDDVLPEVSLGSGEDPIPCKKQPRYNPTRFAVSGRDALGMNTRCEGLLRSERAIRRCRPGSPPKSGLVEPKELVDLWRSDFRTRATEEKISEFEGRMGLARERSRVRLADVAPTLAEDEDLLLANCARRPWSAMPVEVPLRLPPGRHMGIELVVRRGQPLPDSAYQVDVHGRHRDGSLRDVTIVVEPLLDPGSVLGLAIVSAASGDAAEGPDHEVHAVGTEAVHASFLAHRGGAIGSLVFPSLQEEPLLGTIPHGQFDEIAYTPDFYSGHVVAQTDRGEKRTDLGHAALGLRKALSGPVRISLEAKVDSPFGPWRKQIRLYRSRPRLDLVHDLSFHDARLASLRLGTLTLRPEAWDRPSLRFGTVNGGAGVEWRRFRPGASLSQTKAVSSSVSATSCLGATEGWVAIADDARGVLVSTDRARAATVPMLDFEEVDDAFFCRLTHSAAEADETRASFLRGRLSFGFSIEGFQTGEEGVVDAARLRHQGLIYRTETNVGITNGL